MNTKNSCRGHPIQNGKNANAFMYIDKKRRELAYRRGGN